MFRGEGRIGLGTVTRAVRARTRFGDRSVPRSSHDYRIWRWLFFTMVFIAVYLSIFRRYWRLPSAMDIDRLYWHGQAWIHWFSGE